VDDWRDLGGIRLQRFPERSVAVLEAIADNDALLRAPLRARLLGDHA
jgi:hypothetical protein